MGSDTSCTISNEDPLPGESPIIRAPQTNNYAPENFMSRFPDLPQVGTIFDLFEYTKSIAPDNYLYGMRVFENNQWQDRWKPYTRTDIAEMRDSIGSFLIQNGAKMGDCIGILSYNRIEWITVQHACYAYGFVTVPIYDTFGWENIKYIIDHAHIKIIFVISTKYNDLVKVLGDLPFVTNVVIIDAEESPSPNTIQSPFPNITITKYRDALSTTERFPKRPPTPDSPATIMYTSGTTGYPKGCILTHTNLMSTASCFYTFVYPFKSDDRLLSYLPLAHVYESVIHIVGIKCLGYIGFYSGSIKRLIDEVKLFKPTVFIGVSRVFERVMDGLQLQISKKPFLIRSLFNTAFYIKSFITNKLRFQHVPILDKAFTQVRDAMGGEIQLLICGGSALSTDTQNYLKIAFNVSFIQGYGLTETTAGTMVQKSTDVQNGNVGVLLKCTEAKLRDVPELNFYSKDLQGELLLRGTSIFKGYYKDEESTKNAFADGGWFKTGDIFQLTPTRQFQMIGRCKELVKLSQGEYVSLGKLRAIYSTAQYVSQIYIHAGMQSRFLVAIVVVDNDNMKNVTKEKMLQILDEKAKENNLNGFEKIRNVYLTNEEFTTENGLQTPSLKLCDFKIAKKYEKEIEKMEEEIKSL
ncbi:AMP-binding enzyme family protein [Histomonas meleagridis]|uniref:AMP-binding enzyme family protein n=1 Tax=Histomonas meleagridis TaxID=135588 RepID=UPI00355AB42D|nr:AMP-binding enzyme family protein [Histomonas meleagridis]KAH0799394.1 AMP-binding enzyme family protein [Histomonas meleagridis]